MSTPLIVVDSLSQWAPFYPSESVICFEELLNSPTLQKQSKLQVINLCDPRKYLGRGYYCSLIGESRGYRVLPSINTLNDLQNRQLTLIHTDNLYDCLKDMSNTLPSGKALLFRSFFGESCEPFATLAQSLFERLPAPILEIELIYRSEWSLRSVKPLPLSALNDNEQTLFAEALERFNRRVWRTKRTNKRHRWDMAILVNPQEKTPPSDHEAVKRMIKIAARIGIEAECITPKQFNRIAEYDALFIRETTEINHHTYRFARKAQVEGLVVIDDPTSILRCCNKVYLHDAFRRHKVPSLKTLLISSFSKHTIEELEKEFEYPIVLKVPNGSFSVGVEKTANREELKRVLKRMLANSALILAQEYFYTNFDWRIGILNNRPLYACRYYMSKGHWQIYEHGEGEMCSGDFDTMATYEVPRIVLDAALKAAKVIGDGLYGIDIKQDGNRVAVIEVNDNPSLEYGIEDAFLGDELYMQIMSEFVRRLELRGKI